MDNKIGMKLMKHEVLGNILSHLSTAQLLQVRLTSQLFRSVASEICRKRQVRLKPPEEAADTIHETFLSVTNLPWSSCTLSLPSERSQYGILNNLPECLQKFGQHIRSVTVSMSVCCYAELAKIIISLPLLESLRIRDYTSSKASNSAESGVSNLSLSDVVISEDSRGGQKLKKFAGRIYSQESLKFLEWILLRSTPNMVGVYAVGNYADSVMHALSGVQSVFLSLQVDNEGMRKIVAIPGQKLQNLKQLDLQLAIDPGRQAIELLENVQEFLNKLAPNLERFFFGFRGLAVVPKQIELQRMPKLKLLQFTSCWDQVEFKPPLYILKPFVLNQFPLLHRVVLSSYYKNRTNIDLFKSCKFDTVRELVVFRHDSNPMEDDWATVFPNLKSLFSAVNLDSLEYILQRMPGLVSLRLRIEDGQPMNESEKDVNIILTGVLNVDNIYNMQNSSDSVTDRRTYSLRSLTHLKRLELSFPPHLCRRPHPTDDTPDDRMYKFRLRDSGVYFSILELDPLDYLCLSNVKISEALKKNLMERHKVYEHLNRDMDRRLHWRDGAIGEANFEMR